MSFSTGDRVEATKDFGGVFGSDTKQGMTGEVVDTGALGGAEVRWSDGSVSHADSNEIRRR